jgi:uncharacterized protein
VTAARARLYEYWTPILLFGVLTLAESYVPAARFPAAYLIKVLIVTASLAFCRGPLADIRIDPRVVAPSVLLGVVVCVAWVGIDGNLAYPHLGTRTAFDPSSLKDSSWWITFLIVRLYGLVVMVPIMEEIFWRSFILRYLTSPDFQQVPMGTFSASALGVMVAASALAHPEWLVAVVASLAYAWWLRRTGSLFGVIVAHATTNAALGGYVLATGNWKYW